MTDTPAPGAMSDGRRRAMLQAGLMEAEARANAAGHPFEVITESDFEVEFAVTHPPNHWLHRRLTIQTLGLWAPVWFIQSRRGPRRQVYRATVDVAGKVKVARAPG